MARIAGVDLPKNKRIDIALTYIYGIGRKKAVEICSELKVDGAIRSGDLTDQDVNLIREYIEKNTQVEGDLRRQISLSIKRLMDLNSYRGLRHRRGLPVRGQRTSTNARTRKGPRRLAVAMAKKTV